LGGWSFGGLVAVEMGCQLERAGEQVALALIDPTTPGAAGRSALPPGTEFD
jgi:thioesterase domain-containing protein